ncbi:MAG: RNA polymerase sigma factor [Minisyncoccia bacterium]
MTKKATQKLEDQRQSTLASAHSDYGKGLNSYALFKTSNHATSEDLVQDTFIKTWSYLVKNGKIDNMKAFLYHILNHLIVDEYRKHKSTSLDVLLEKGFEPTISDHDRFINVIDGEKALLLIFRLPRTYQNVMHMRHVQDLSLKEISLITGQSKNAIAVQLHRGLEKLKVLYHNEEFGHC